MLRYQILGVGQQKQKYRSWLDKTMPVIEQYNAIGKAIKAKSLERKELQTERGDCTVLQLVKKHDLTVKIDAVTEEIEDLKSEKAMMLSNMEYADDTAVQAEEKSLQAIQKELPGLDRRKAELTEKEKMELEQYNEVSAQIAPAEKNAIWDARAMLRPAKTEKVETVLRNGYGDKFNSSQLNAARREINYELGEGNLDDAALSIRRRLKAAKELQIASKKSRHRQDFER